MLGFSKAAKVQCVMAMRVAYDVTEATGESVDPMDSAFDMALMLFNAKAASYTTEYKLQADVGVYSSNGKWLYNLTIPYYTHRDIAEFLLDHNNNHGNLYITNREGHEITDEVMDIMRIIKK